MSASVCFLVAWFIAHLLYSFPFPYSSDIHWTTVEEFPVGFFNSLPALKAL